MERQNVAGSDVYRILAVDDEPIVHSMLDMLIKKSHLPVVLAGTASSGVEAVRMAEEIKPDICLMDINMEDMDGLEAGARIAEVLDPKPCIIYLTAHDRFDYARRAVKVGAMDFILKPIRREELYEALRVAITHLQAERLEEIEREALRERVHAILPGVSTTGGTARQSRMSAIAHEVKEFVKQNYSRKISLESAADHVCLSAGYLGPLFKSETGVSFRSYLRSVRVAEAKRLMSDHTLNLTQIAQMVGFDDQNYFSQVFLEETGIRPGEYRGGGRRWPR